MVLHITRVQRQMLADHARREFPRECCGLLFGARAADAIRLGRVEPCANITPDNPARNYQIDWKALFHAVRDSRSGTEALVGFYHSHPDGSEDPSSQDRLHAWCDYVYLILPITEDAAGSPTAWRLSEPGSVARPVNVVVTNA